MKRLLRKLLFALYLFVVTFMLLEIGVRLSGYSERHLCDPIYTSFPSTPDIPYVHKPGLEHTRARGLAVINTDSLGLRSPTAGARYDARREDEFRIAIVGDSVTFGEGVEKTVDTYAQVLEDTLNQRQSVRRVKVFNFGAFAYSVKVMAATLRHRVLAVEPDLVLMSIIPADFNLSRTPSVDEWGYLTDNKLSGYLRRDSSIRLGLRKVHLLYLVRDLLYPLLDQSEKAEDVLATGRLPESYAYLKGFKDTAVEHKINYRIVLLPSLLGGFNQLPAQLRRDGIATLDLSALGQLFTRAQFRASRFDPHPSANVHRRIGESLAEDILASHLLIERK